MKPQRRSESSLWRMFLAPFLALGLLASTGCAPAHSRTVVENRVSVEIHIAPQPDELPFNPRGERLVAASRQLSALLGHGLQIDIDAALAAEWKSDFEHQLIDSIEGLLRLLTDLREQDAGEFARTTQAFERLECRYSILVEYAKVTFTGGKLLIEQPAHPTRLIDYGAVLDAFHDLDVIRQELRFANLEPEAVAPSDAAAYFHWFVKNGYGYRWEKRHQADRPRNDVASSERRLDVISRIVRLYSRVDGRDSTLTMEMRKWLMSQLPSLAAASNSPVKGGERVFCDWVQKELPRGSAEERLESFENLFPMDRAPACPQLDRFAMGLREADAWLTSGKPVERDATAEYKLIDSTVCPSLRDAERKPERRSGCRSNWLRFSLHDDALRKRLATALDARDPDLTEQLFASLHYDKKADAIALLRLLDPRKPALGAALTAIAEAWGGDLPPKEMLIDIWRAQPARRGDILYIYARAKEESFWRTFVNDFGLVGEGELGRFLDHGEPAWGHLLNLWPAIDKTHMRIQPVINHLSAAIQDANQPAAGAALRVLAGIVQRLCDNRSKAELAALHAALEVRVGAHASERKALAMLLRDTAPNGCASRNKEDPTDEP